MKCHIIVLGIAWWTVSSLVNKNDCNLRSVHLLCISIVFCFISLNQRLEDCYLCSVHLSTFFFVRSFYSFCTDNCKIAICVLSRSLLLLICKSFSCRLHVVKYQVECIRDSRQQTLEGCGVGIVDFNQMTLMFAVHSWSMTIIPNSGVPDAISSRLKNLSFVIHSRQSDVGRRRARSNIQPVEILASHWLRVPS